MSLEAAAAPAPVSQDPAAHVASLAAAFGTEKRLLEELARVLRSQREGVSSNDLEKLDDSVYSAQRIFRTLHEARLQRRILLELMGAREGASLQDLESILGRWSSDSVIEARDQLVVAARALAREVEMNRTILNGAMEVGDQLIRAFTGSTEPAPVYAPGDAPEAGGSAGSLLNTRA